MLQLDPDDPDEEENKVLTALSSSSGSASINATNTGSSNPSVLSEADKIALSNYKVLTYFKLNVNKVFFFSIQSNMFFM